MADTKISALPASTTPLTGTEVLPVVQSGTTKQVSVANLTAGRAVSALSTTVTGNSILNGALASDVGLLKNIGRGYGVASERWIGSDGTFTTWFYNVPTGGNHYFAINNVNKLTIVGDNVNIPDGNLIPATAAKGVNFTANTPAAGMTSQLLNWYEEGTWTPTVQGSGTAGTYQLDTGASYSSYTRIGRQVTLQSQIVLAGTVTGGGSGTLNIVGLPFTKGDSQNPVGAISLASVDMDNSARYATIRFASGGASSTLIVYQILDNANGISMPISAAVANAVFVFTLTYFV